MTSLNADVAPTPSISELSSPHRIMPPCYAQSGRILFGAAAFVCAVLPAVLCVHAYRRRRAEGVIDKSAADGLDSPGAFDSLPINYSPTTKEEAECAVCLCMLMEGEQVKKPKHPGCGHIFHVGCIDVWLLSHSTCSLCRSPAAAEAARSESTIVPTPSVHPAVCEWQGDLGTATRAGARLNLLTSTALSLTPVVFSVASRSVHVAEGGNGSGQLPGPVDLESYGSGPLDPAPMSPRCLGGSLRPL